VFPKTFIVIIHMTVGGTLRDQVPGLWVRVPYSSPIVSQYLTF